MGMVLCLASSSGTAFLRPSAFRQWSWAPGRPLSSLLRGLRCVMLARPHSGSPFSPQWHQLQGPRAMLCSPPLPYKACHPNGGTRVPSSPINLHVLTSSEERFLVGGQLAGVPMPHMHDICGPAARTDPPLSMLVCLDAVTMGRLWAPLCFFSTSLREGTQPSMSL